MGKEHKIKRYGFENQYKRRQKIKKIVVTLAAVAAACFAGWFLYEPVYQFVVNFELPDLLPTPATSQSESSSLQQSSSQVTPGTGQEQSDFIPMADTMAYVPVYLLKDAATMEANFSKLKAQGIKGVVFELKAPGGQVMYQSSLESVANTRAQVEGAYDLSAAVAAAQKVGLVPVGRISAFLDSTATLVMYDAAVKYMDSNVNWIDNSKAAGGKTWLNPNSRDAQNYILDLVGEAADKGLHSVILDNVQFPEGYSLQLATYGVTGDLDKSAILADFITRAKELSKDSNFEIWLGMDLKAAAGTETVRFGNDPGKVIAAAQRCVLSVMPEQFGAGVATDSLTLSNPALTPYETVKASLEAANNALGDDLQLVAMIQAYTSTTLPQGSNMPYGKEEIEQQVKAANEAGIEKIYYYNPGGTYELS